MVKRTTCLALALVHLATFDVVASTTVELARPEYAARLIDFSVDATHVYVAYERFGVDNRQTLGDDEGGAVLGIYSRSDGTVTASVKMAELWEAHPQMRPASLISTVAYKDGVVVSPNDNAARDLFLVLVDRAGNVVRSRHVRDFHVMALIRFGDFVLASGPGGLALFDESLDLKHAWSTPDTLALARTTANEILVVDGLVDRRTWAFSRTVRMLSLVGDQLVERVAVEVPVEVVHWINLNIVNSDAGYSVWVPNGCAVWTRRYGRSFSVAPRQFGLPAAAQILESSTVCW